MGITCTRLASKRNIRLLLLGLDSAGKTTILQNLNKEETDEIQIPTMGFSSRSFTQGRYRILLMDVGGGPDIRPIWPKYFAETHGLIYVIDLNDGNRFNEAKEELRKVLMDERMTCKPLLIVFNKADKCDGVIDMMDVMYRLDINNILMESGNIIEGLVQPKIRLWLCSALKSKTRNRQDKNLSKSFNWLLTSISEHWTVLSPRVDAQHGVELKEKERAKEERIRKRKEKREEERLEREAIATVNEAHTVSSPQGADRITVINSKPDQSLIATLNIVAEIEKGNESLNLNNDRLIPEPQQSSKSVVLLDSTSHNDHSISLASGSLPQNGSVLPPIISTVNEIPVVASINKTVTWSNEILASKEGDTPSSMRKNPLPPIHVCVTPPTKLIEKDLCIDKKRTSDDALPSSSILHDDSKQDIMLPPLESESKQVTKIPKTLRKIKLKLSKNRNKTFPANEVAVECVIPNSTDSSTAYASAIVSQQAVAGYLNTAEDIDPVPQ